MTLRPFIIGSALVASSAFTPPVSAQNLTSLGPVGGSAIEIAIDPLDGDRILVIPYTVGLFLSTDGGDSFDPFPSSLPNDADELIQDPTNGQILYALSGTSVYRSPDFGANWSVLGLVSAESLKNLAVAPGGLMLAVDAFNVYRSSDFGANWSTVASVVPFAGTVLDDAIFAPSDSTRAYYSSTDGIAASTDSGATWFNPGPYDEWVQALTVDPNNADTVFVGTPFNGVSRSTDGGANFTDITTPVVDGNSEFFAWEPSGRLWYMQLQGVAYTTDLGNTWIDSTAGLFMNPMPIPAALAFGPTGQRFLGAESNVFPGGNLGGGLYRMEAADTSWDHIGFLSDVIYSTAIAAPGGRRLVGVGAGPLAALPGDPLESTAWGSITFAVSADPDNPNRWVVGGVGSFSDNAQIVTLTGNGSTATVRYERFGAGSVQVIEFDPQDSDHAVAGMFPAGFGSAAIVVSTNAGNNWTEIAGTSGWATRDLAFDPHTPGRVLQLSDNGQWAESLDSGFTWGALQPAWPTTFSSAFLAFDPHVPGRLYRGESGMGLWLSTDDGANWTFLGVPLHQSADIAFDPATPGVFWIGNTSGEILVTVDAGANFTTVATIPGGSSVTSLSLDTASGALLVGSAGASAWELDVSIPVVYCTAKTSSAGCTAEIATSAPLKPVSGAGGYFINASGVQNNKAGLLFASISGIAALPFNGGTLCMFPPLKRGPTVFSSGTGGPTNDCSGSFSTLINNGAVIPAGLDAGPGGTAAYQYWYRDPAGGAGNLGTALSNAVLVEFK